MNPRMGVWEKSFNGLKTAAKLLLLDQTLIPDQFYITCALQDAPGLCLALDGLTNGSEENDIHELAINKPLRQQPNQFVWLLLFKNECEK